MGYGGSDIVKSFEYDWSQAYGTVQMSGREENINSGPEAVLDLLQAKMNNVARSMRDTFAHSIYSNNYPADSDPSVSTEAPYGLQYVCEASRALGGQAAADWHSGGMSKDGGDFGGTTGTQLSFGNLKDSSNDAYIQTIFRNAYKDLSVGGDSPSMITVSYTHLRAHET